MRIQVEELEQLLRYWEDVMSVLEMASAYGFEVGGNGVSGARVPFEGLVAHWQDVRRSLGDRKAVGPLTRRLEEFSPRLRAVMTGNLQVHETIASRILQWSAESRRVYALSREMVDELSRTSLRDMLWSDVRLPFPSFAIRLPDVPSDLPGLTSMILVNTINTSPAHYVFALVPDLREHLLRPDVREDIQRFTRSGRKGDKHRKRAFRALRNFFTGMKVPPFPAVIERADRESVLESFRATKTSEGQLIPNLFHRIRHLILNVALYVQTSPASDPKLKPAGYVEAERLERRGVLPADVFTLDVRERRLPGTVLPDVSSALEDAGSPRGSVIPHFRSGYYRRASGQGHNPDAPKLIHVPWTIVNEHMLKEGEVPAGLYRRTESES